MNLNESIIKIRVELQKAKLKKTGKNEYAGVTYFELADFLPKLNELMLQEKINDIFTIETDANDMSVAKLTLIKGEEKQEYKMPFIRFDTPVNNKKDKVTGEVKEVKSMQDIQYLGALNTYYKRYLYINAFGITDGDLIDKIDTDTLVKKEQTASEKQVAMLEKYYQGENLEKLLEANNITELKEISMKKASEIIKEILKKAEGTNNVSKNN